jgi:coenzyme F420 biosynthesis associated uncharacterized protein
MQAGLLLAYLASRVLGQYELFLPPDPDAGGDSAPAGRLTLVAPNIVMVERELGVDQHDFRRWVCLHEETHRTQFTAVPWLRGYVQEQMTEFLLASELDPAAILKRVRAAADAVAGAVRGTDDSESLIEAIQTPQQRAILDRLTCVMTLVEGHGDYVMDAVGPQVVPSVEQIRERFNARRGTAGRTERAIRRILGIDLKMKQYAQGSKFVRTIVDDSGMAVFNKVWGGPQTLPTMDELSDPQAWLDRVGHGHGAIAAGGSSDGSSGGSASSGGGWAGDYTTDQAGAGANGADVNGADANRADVNGADPNAADGHAADGHAADGHAGGGNGDDGHASGGWDGHGPAEETG